jgi:hypothetical protein
MAERLTPRSIGRPNLSILAGYQGYGGITRHIPAREVVSSEESKDEENG